MTLAYIDPGSGSILLQALLASLVGGVAIFWYKIKTFFRGGKGKDTPGAEQQNNHDKQEKQD